MSIRLLIAVAVLLAACGDMEHAPTDYTPAADRLATIGDDAKPPRAAVARADSRAAAPAPPSPAMLAATVRVVPLRPLGRDSLRGSVRLTPQGAATLASIALAGGASETSYRGAVRAGRCDLLAATVVALLDVTADSTGQGRATTVLAIPTDSLMRHPHAIVYGKGGRPAACGEIAPG